MTVRIAVAPTIHQSVHNASQALSRAATGLNGWTTWESLCQAETAIRRAEDDLRKLRGPIRAMKLEIKQAERRAAVDRDIVARSRSAKNKSMKQGAPA